MRIAVLDRDRCKPEDCAPSKSKPCIKYCPRVRTGDETIVLDEEEKCVHITESLCSGCGICIKKCPFTAIHIENLPEALEKDLTHRYAADGFALFRMVMPKPGQTLGLIGQNGTGKSTCIKILGGELKMNLGLFGDEDPSWDEIITHFRGSELQNYLTKLRNKELKILYKPQNITDLPKAAQGKVQELLEKVDETGHVELVITQLGLDKILDRTLDQLSGGELQRVALAATLLRDGDVYLFDEPTSYLDVKERLNMARLVRGLTDAGKTVIVVEHDLAILDYLSDQVCLLYGKPGAFGIVSHPQGVRVGINIYLNGYLKDENMRIRDEPVRFHDRPPALGFDQGSVIFSFMDMKKQLGDFSLEVCGGEIHAGEIIGILGPNGIGKTTFMNLIAGKLEPDSGVAQLKDLKIAYKPQYISLDDPRPVEVILREVKRKSDLEETYIKRVERQLEIAGLMNRPLTELSGGEQQRVAIAQCLMQSADIYLLDEPSAFLDVEMRLQVAKLIRKSIEDYQKCAFVVEHDIITQDFIADSLLVFEGTPGIYGKANPPVDLRAGMNMFLKDMNVTFRRDPQTGRPRVNKVGSRKDKMQRELGEYYYITTTTTEDESSSLASLFDAKDEEEDED
ncbi:MAG TPA: ribosome biogenesis/translation initiation ATPase RLI [Candidatus Lokiarchaeia archaeon]|nr:ribosome biogenesis/translation initiation ATPase RLI [Candidatus Lokiarchaeia archaeon]